MSSKQISLSICICTSGRPAELERCLASIAAGSQLPTEVIVSDDGRDAGTSEAIANMCSRFPSVRYLVGPRRGLCANRNAVIEASTTTHVSLLDDDAVVGREFVARALTLIKLVPRTIFSGDVLENGTRLSQPVNPSRWGHFGAEVQSGELLRNIQLNCNTFPRAAFADAAFDERLVYGYEDTDLCDRLVRRGWQIEHRPELCNQHLPPHTGGPRVMLAERERFPVLFRLRSTSGRLDWQSLPTIPLAALHAAAAYARRNEWGWMVRLPGWILRGIWLASLGPKPTQLSPLRENLNQEGGVSRR